MSEQTMMDFNPDENPIDMIQRLSGINIENPNITYFSVNADEVLSRIRMRTGEICSYETLIREINPTLRRFGLRADIGKIDGFDAKRLVIFKPEHKPEITKSNNSLTHQQMFTLACRVIDGEVKPNTRMYDFKVTRPNISMANSIVDHFRDLIAEDTQLATSMVREIVRYNQGIDIASIMSEVEYGNKIRSIMDLGYSREDAEKMIRALNEGK